MKKGVWNNFFWYVFIFGWVDLVFGWVDLVFIGFFCRLLKKLDNCVLLFLYLFGKFVIFCVDLFFLFFIEIFMLVVLFLLIWILKFIFKNLNVYCFFGGIFFVFCDLFLGYFLFVLVVCINL